MIIQTLLNFADFKSDNSLLNYISYAKSLAKNCVILY